MLILATLLSATPALANHTCEDEDVHEHECDQDHDEGERDDDKDDMDLAVGLHGLWGDHGSAQTLRAQLSAPSDAYLVFDGRFHVDGRALGRIGAGLDVLGGGRAHLTLGVFAGTAADWKHGVVLAAPQAGGAAGLGYDMDRLGFGYQWRAGWGGGKLDQLLTEHEATVTYRVVRELRVVGTYLRMDPGSSEPAENAVGLGATYTF